MLAIPQVGAYAEELTDGTAAFEEIMSETEELPVIGASGITEYDLSVTVGGTQSITLTSSSALNNPSCINLLMILNQFKQSVPTSRSTHHYKRQSLYP